MFVKYIQQLPNAAILKKNIPQDQYLDYVKTYIARLKERVKLIVILEKVEDLDKFSSINQLTVQSLVRESEKQTMFKQELLLANNMV
ncbi:hypothetical protein KC660_04780 [Candidatus Dojkabacteria bacterium]|uniref:Uncharacterized protein n=1 Tax=Candidatus Dojkabacteria bacterium TaxID=2099670 RepID=A0A955L4E4_9BACT|nr:hypothetical protein [Candidatus Dojkabacteria bacterium]